MAWDSPGAPPWPAQPAAQRRGRRRARGPRLCAAVLILLLLSGILPLAAQESSYEPEPYRDDEFPEWLVKLRRFEVIAVGTFPAALIVSNLGYSLYRLVEAAAEGGAPEREGLPVFLGLGGAEALSDRERRGVLAVSLSLSGTVALLDLILGFVNDHEEQDHEEHAELPADRR